jgi:hypothetical protein
MNLLASVVFDRGSIGGRYCGGCTYISDQAAHRVAPLAAWLVHSWRVDGSTSSIG